jgi:ACR3 family arsenite efflux pump ArsB
MSLPWLNKVHLLTYLHYQTCFKVVLTRLIQSWYNKNVTRLMTQGCNNISISWLYRSCWNNLATSTIVSTRLLEVFNSLFQINLLATWDKQCEHNLLTACLADLLQDVRFLRVKLCSHCLFPVVVTSLEQAVNNL